MDGTVITELKAVLSAERAKAVEVDGRWYLVDGDGRWQDIQQPFPVCLQLGSLEGLVQYARWELGDVDVAYLVKDAWSVTMAGRLRERQVRWAYAVAGCALPSFIELLLSDGGVALPPSEAITALLAHFEPTSELSDLLAVLGNLADVAVRTLADDGVTSVATTKLAVERKSEAHVGPTVHLESALLSFPELGPLPIRLVLRLYGGGDSGKPIAVRLKMADPEFILRAKNGIHTRLKDLDSKATVIL